jgi:hypothetical protein
MKKISVLLFIICITSVSLFAQKLKAEEIIAKHLDSIGKAEDLAKVTNMTFTGDVNFSQGSSNEGIPANGKFVLASEGSNVLLGMSFPVSSYPLEKVVYNGQTVNVAFTRPGVRSAFGEYLLSFGSVTREGLLGGVLSKNWALANLAFRNAKVSASGTKKIDGKEVYVLSYSPKKGSDVDDIRLYFDKETFRHIRTEYKKTISAQMGSNPNASASQLESFKNMTEDYSDFKTENGITLPRVYKTFVFIQLNRSSREYYYTTKINELYFNQKLENGTFIFE